MFFCKFFLSILRFEWLTLTLTLKTDRWPRSILKIKAQTIDSLKHLFQVTQVCCWICVTYKASLFSVLFRKQRLVFVIWWINDKLSRLSSLIREYMHLMYVCCCESICRWLNKPTERQVLPKRVYLKQKLQSQKIDRMRSTCKLSPFCALLSTFSSPNC